MSYRVAGPRRFSRRSKQRSTMWCPRQAAGRKPGGRPACAPRWRRGVLAAQQARPGGTWISAGEPLCLIGDSDTGKSHLLIGLGTAAAQQGFRVRPGHEAGQRARRGRRRTSARQDDRPLRAGRAALHRRARLHGTRPPRRRAALPGPHRARGNQLLCHRLEPAVLRLHAHLHRSEALRGDHRPAQLRRKHSRDRHQFLPPRARGPAATRAKPAYGPTAHRGRRRSRGG